MAIPPTGGRYATLPVGRHQATFEQVYEAFVENAPFRDDREVIFEALTLYAKIVANLCPGLALWVNGGFITHKSWAAPKDADVVVVVPQAHYPNVCSNPSVWTYITLQGVIVSDPSTGGGRIGRIQPMAGLIDGFIISDDPTLSDVWAYRWSLVNDEDGNLLPDTTRKGFLEVKL
ncbi:DUF6932 family protein [Mycolicibacterium celeriflavum]|uniref:Uncharacterized protein n=1 Tax=Mycolicibacterium celeriflavum TaxID=1249101 RepID=A0A7I7RFB8_MYCCF|nr:hypothetical protein [Mycolicibacterium celeriflavum]MCV7239547.1 hypothetical protein [Mycolicibacterium celeriflavum]BBY43238.1 hypothetical protein MCEL_15330 [Mycolicibacterium celeriflavum]